MPLIFVRPPHAGSDFFASGVNPGTAGGIFAEREGAEPAERNGITGVVEINGVGATRVKSLGKIDEHRILSALVLQWSGAQQNLVNVEEMIEVDLEERIVLEHAEVNRMLA